MSKTFHTLISFLFFLSIVGPAFTQENSQFIHSPAFDKILKENNLAGSILIFDKLNNTFYSNDFEWAKTGRLPASTYKVPHTIIALSTGVMEHEESILKWDGNSRYLKVWEQDLTLRQALQLSCVPCYQQIARSIGVDRMKTYLEKIEFGTMDVTAENLDVFWLEGNSKINQFQQIGFYLKLFNNQLNVDIRIQETIKEMILLEDNDGYKLRGKTGWAIRNGHNNGWFVGYLEAGTNEYFFSSNVDPDAGFDMSLFAVIRKDITQKALEEILKKK